MDKRYRSLKHCAVASCFLINTCGFANELVVRIFNDHDLLASPLPMCSIEHVQECKSTLVNAFELVQNPLWQGLLHTTTYSSVRLLVAAGTYRLTSRLDLKWGASYTGNVPLLIQGAGKSTVISGGQVVDAWSKLSSSDPAVNRIPERARGKVLVADLSSIGLHRSVPPHVWGYGYPIQPVFTELFVSGVAQPVAHWPNSGYGRLQRPIGLGDADKVTFSIAGRSVADWVNEPNLQALAFWAHDWAAQSIPVDSLDLNRNSLRLSGSGSPYGIKSNQRVRIDDALVELDSPGEWYVDSTNSKIYYFPDSKFKSAVTEVSVASGLLGLRDSSQITVQDMTLEKTTGDAVEVLRGDRVVFERVDIRLTGNRALVIKDSSQSGIRDSVIEENGEGGVYLSGGDRSTLTAAHNFVDSSTIRRFSRLAKTARHAVELEGVGHRVRGNVISDAPHTAILFKGNDHLISENEIFDVVKETGDAGAIYVGRDFTVHGTVIEKNFFHNIIASSSALDVKGIYIDDQASGITVRCNAFARVDQPVFIGGGRSNVVEKNLFFQSSPAIHLDARGVRSQRRMTLDPKGTLQRGLDAVPYRSEVFAHRFPTLALIREDDIGAPKYNIFRGNVIIFGEAFRIFEEALGGISTTGNLLYPDGELPDRKFARATAISSHEARNFIKKCDQQR